MPPYLITTKEGIGIAIFEDDSPMTRRIKEFMALYEIVDIRMRMLKVDELKRIMGFPTDYILIGTQSEQKKVHRQRRGGQYGQGVSRDIG